MWYLRVIRNSIETSQDFHMPAEMQIYGNKRMCLHKKRVELNSHGIRLVASFIILVQKPNTLKMNEANIQPCWPNKFGQ